MKFLEKIENALNAFLVLIGGLMKSFFVRLVPVKIKHLFVRAVERLRKILAVIKSLPATARPWLAGKIGPLKQRIQSYNYKAKLKDAYSKTLLHYNVQGSGKFQKIRMILMTPVLIIAGWFKGLSPLQSMLMLGFTAASILSGINMIFSGKRILDQHAGIRAPASIELGAEYDRPEYYKKQLRHFEVTNFRLPVFIPEVNEQRTVDIDFSATVSNRAARKYLEKHEFELRDHFILNVEPLPASFPVTEEGRDILQSKLLFEINEFLITRKVEGTVLEMRLTYILAN